MLQTNPVLAKMMISGVVYTLGDWIAQVEYIYFLANELFVLEVCAE